MTAFMDIYANNPLRFGSRSLMLHTLDGNLARLVHSGGEIPEFGIAPDRLKARQHAAMGHMVHARPHHQFHRTVARMKQRPEILATEVRRKRASIMCSEPLTAFPVSNTRAYGNEFEQVLVPFQ